MPLNIALKLALVATGKKQRRIARLVRIREVHLSRIVHGHRPATDEERKRLAEFLKREVTELFPDCAA